VSRRQDGGRRRGARTSAVRRLVLGEAGFAPAVILAGVALVISFVAIAGPRALVTADNRATSQAVAQAPALDVGALVTADLQAGPGAGVLSAATIGALSGRLAAELPSPRDFPAARRLAGVSLPTLTALNAAPSAIADSPPIVEVAFRTGLGGHCLVLAGSLPVGPGVIRPGRGTAPGTVIVPVAASEATAARFSLRVGSLLDLVSPRNGDPAVWLRVTGIVRPTRTASSFWQFDPALDTPLLEGSTDSPYWQGGFFAGPGGLTAIGTGYAGAPERAFWYFPLSTDLTAADVSRLETGVAALASSAAPRNAEIGSGASVLQDTTVSTGIANGLAAFNAQWQSTIGSDSVLVAGLFVAGLILLLICCGLAAEAYRSELVLIRVRGGSLAQVAGRAFIRSCCITLPALAGGAVLAIAALPGGGSAAGWVLGALTALTAVAGTPVICAATHRRLRFADARRRAGAVARPSARRLVAELMVLLVASAAIADVRLRGPGSGTTAPYLSASAVLVAALVGLAVNRVYRGPLRALARGASTRRGPVSAIGPARAARSRAGSVLPALVLILTLTLTAFGAMVVAAISAGQLAASWAQVGADATISTTGSSTVTTADLHVIRQVAGVRQATAVYTAPSYGPLGGILASGKSAGTPVGLAVVDPASYGALAADTPWPTFPATALAQSRSHPAAPVPILVTPSVAARIGSSDLRVVVGGIGVPVRIVGTITDTAAKPTGGDYVVVPSWAAARLPSILPPSIVMLTGSAISVPALRVAAAQVLPGSHVTVRRQVLSALVTSPALQLSASLYRTGALTAALLSALAAAFALAASGRSRAVIRARLAALGMARRQSFILGLTDAIPLLAVAVIGSVAASWLLVEAVGPVLGLNVFTGSSVPVTLRPTWPGLVVPLAGVAALALVLLAIDGVLSGRREIGPALREEETS
jgi:putative ABC transport system permease protein